MLSPPATQKLQWRVDQLRQWNGQSFIPSIPQCEVFTDAFDLGWGIEWNQKTCSGQWNPQELPLHINHNELLVIWKMIRIRALRRTAIKIYCDNMTIISYVNKWGEGTRSTPLMNLARQIWNVCLNTNTRFHLTYVASPFNPGDGSSRRLMTQLKWRIAPSYFRHLERKWGPHSLDLFASHLNH